MFPRRNLVWSRSSIGDKGISKNVVTLGMRCCRLSWAGFAGGAASAPDWFTAHPVPSSGFYVAKFSAYAAEAWARSHGATDAEIESARRCLRDAPARTARAGQWTVQ